MNFKYEPTISLAEQVEALRRANERLKRKVSSLTSSKSQYKAQVRELRAQLGMPRTLTQAWLERAE